MKTTITKKLDELGIRKKNRLPRKFKKKLKKDPKLDKFELAYQMLEDNFGKPESIQAPNL